MKPLIVLLSVFITSILIFKMYRGSYNWTLSGRIAMSIMLTFTATAHFTFTTGMSMMLPDYVPYKMELVYLTGIIELAFAVGLLIPKIKIITGWLLIVFFLFVLPANIFASLKRIDFQNGTLNGNGPLYLWFRIPLQFFFIFWTYKFGILGNKN